ncbi:MAG TPA: ATP-binding cassette domain-containing protein, partial [Candidatus Acidoferrum sp.]|nr:ATP-binding cassette domain-containing protein [Candidatus Acidoferrum sp.]
MIEGAQPAERKPNAGSSRAGVILESRSLKKTYGSGEKSVPVLLDANLALRQGEMVAVVAPSGAGKSTLLHLLAALDTPTSGTVYFDSKAIETNDDVA